MTLSPGWSLRDCAVEWDQPERDMVEFSTLCFSPARDLSLSRNLLANQFSVRCPNEESDFAFGVIHFRRVLGCNFSRPRPVGPFFKKGVPHGRLHGAGL